MVTADGTGTLGPCKPRRRNARQRRRERIRMKSRKLVRSGKIARTPCVVCGSKENLEIHHHVEPMRPDGFVFLCEAYHKQAHRPA